MLSFRPCNLVGEMRSGGRERGTEREREGGRKGGGDREKEREIEGGGGGGRGDL